MIDRRRFLVAGAATCLMAAAPQVQAPPADRIAFRVMRKDEAIGIHALDFHRVEDGFDVRLAIDIAVRFGSIVVFRYTLRGLEQWRGGRPVHLEAETDDDGTKRAMRTESGSEGLWVTGTDVERYLAPPDTLPATHWNMAELVNPWLNPQDGKLLHPRVGAETEGEVELGDGSRRRAARYPLTGDAKLDLWYDQEKRWTGLGFDARDGSRVSYQLI